MDVTQLPFNRLIGLESADCSLGLYASLPDGPQFTNHVGTVHASALLAVAEAGSGAFLAARFTGLSEVIALVRRFEAKFHRPANGRVSARISAEDGELATWADDLAARGRVLASVPVEVVDASGNTVMSAKVEWFISKTVPKEEFDAKREVSE